MDKVKIGIPRSIHYYYYGRIWKEFFEQLDCEVIVSPHTTKEIINNGIDYANDEMCLAMKIYIGHINYLKDKCDYILIPRIDNYGINDQTCTNFLALYDIINNLFDVKILNYNIDLNKNKTELAGLLSIGAILGKKRKDIIRAYKIALIKNNKILKKERQINSAKLKSDKIKILLVAHPYNIYDNYIGYPIIKYLEKLNIEVMFADKFDTEITNSLSLQLSETIYWKHSKDIIGSIIISQEKIDGIIFLSSFPCGPDSLVNELVMRKITIPKINIIIDDIDSLTGIQTRLESFIDILEQQKERV